MPRSCDMLSSQPARLVDDVLVIYNKTQDTYDSASRKRSAKRVQQVLVQVCVFISAHLATTATKDFSKAQNPVVC